MYTQCPNCSALFRISGEQLRSAGGHVRCGGCQKVFYALDSLSEHLDDFNKPDEGDLFVDEVMEAMDDFEEETPLTFPDASIASSLLQPAGDTRHDRPDLFIDEVAAAMDEHAEAHVYPTVTEEVPKDGDKQSLDEAGEEETREALRETASDQSTTGKPAADVPLVIRAAPVAAMRSGREIALWLFAITFLLMTLLGQVAYFKRDDLARRYTSLRPYIEKLCQYAGCRLGTTGDIATIHILDRQVRSHPQQKGALQVTAIFASTSQLSQPFPDVMLTMSDKQGTAIAGRRFTPGEYLEDTNLIKQGMQPKTPYRLHLELEDPGEKAVGFSFSFHATSARK
jgi:predicted Zn finger-like uncharacterized protein